MEIFATITQKVNIDPLDVIKELSVLPDGGEWVALNEQGDPVMYEEVSAGQHSYDKPIRVLTKEEYEVYLAKETLIKFLTKKSIDSLMTSKRNIKR